MTTQISLEDRSARWALRSTVLIGYLLAGVAFARLMIGDLGMEIELPGALTFGLLLAIPPTLALTSSPHRSSQLRTAGTLAVVAAFFTGIAGVLLFAFGITWVWLAGRDSTHFQIDGKLLFSTGLWATAFLVLHLHDDPVCYEAAFTTCASDSVVWWEAGVSIVLGMTAGAATWFFSTPIETTEPKEATTQM